MTVNIAFIQKEYNIKLTTIGALFTGYDKIRLKRDSMFDAYIPLYPIEAAAIVTENTTIFNMVVLGYYK